MAGISNNSAIEAIEGPSEGDEAVADPVSVVNTLEAGVGVECSFPTLGFLGSNKNKRQPVLRKKPLYQITQNEILMQVMRLLTFREVRCL